jgi:aspartokinase/homoserine dehydrogenase 1
VFHKNIPIKILNTHNPTAPGTLITDSIGNEKGSIRGISPMKKISVVTLEGDLASNVAEINTRTYNAMARNGISMFLVSQPDKESTFSFSLTTADADRALGILKSEFEPELQTGDIHDISLVKDMSIIAVVGEKIKDLVGLEARITYVLKRNDINVYAVSNGASETTITIVVSEESVNKALTLVHGACF